MTKEALVQLSRKFLQGNASAAEQQELHDWYDQLSETVDADEVIVTQHEESADIVRKRILTGINAGMEHRDTSPHVVVYPSRLRKWMTVAAVAFLVLLAGAGGYWLLRTTTNPGQASVAKSAALILPGKAPATLLLANQHAVPLNGHTPQYLRQANSIIKYFPGQLTYQSMDTAGAMVYNELRTPRGGRYRLVLSDGTRVWLDAASSLHYPVAFHGGTREVELHGEAYFEVAPGGPFHIRLGPQVTVLAQAQRFNISAYPDDPTIGAALLDGSLHYTSTKRHASIYPCQELQAQADSIQVSEVEDMATLVSWKEPQYQFRHVQLDQLARRMGRWYNINVKYAPTAHQRLVSGFLRMDRPLTDAMQNLQQAGVSTNWDGYTLTLR